MTRGSDELARALAMMEYARKSRRRRPALLKDPTLQTLLSDLVAARTAAGMTQQDVALRMWTTTSAISRLESGRYARPTLDTIEKYAMAVGRASKSGCGIPTSNRPSFFRLWPATERRRSSITGRQIWRRYSRKLDCPALRAPNRQPVYQMGSDRPDLAIAARTRHTP
jgi:transcriptional regulator with XRE-family HTH domain